MEYIVCRFGDKESEYIGKTEDKLNLKPGYYSQAIDYIEKDSNDPLDVVYFLAKGDMGDLILRTNKRSMSTHFATNNFPNITKLRTSQKLNVYCVYESSMKENHQFIKSFKEKFPQSISQNIVFSKKMTVLKIVLIPKVSTFQNS